MTERKKAVSESGCGISCERYPVHAVLRDSLLLCGCLYSQAMKDVAELSFFRLWVRSEWRPMNGQLYSYIRPAFRRLSSTE